MEIRLLRYVMAVAEYQSFTRAARHLHLAQPSLSQQIARLESQLGMMLFVRGSGPITLTAEGRHFVRRAEQIVQMHDDFMRELSERRSGMGTELSVGAPAITGGHLLPPLLSDYGVRFPHVHVRLVEETPETVERLTVRGLIDLAVLALPLETDQLVTRHLLTEPLMAVLPDQVYPWMDSALQARYAFDQESPARLCPLSILEAAPFILLKSGYGFRQTVLSLCAEAGFQPRMAYETSNIDVAQSLVAYGHGVTLVPAMVRRTGSARLVYYHLVGDPTRTLVFAYRNDRYLSMTATAFMDLATSHIMFAGD